MWADGIEKIMRRWVLSALSFQTTDSDSERKAANEEGRHLVIDCEADPKASQSNQSGLEWCSAWMRLFQTWTPSSPHSAQTPIARMQARPNHIQPLHLGARRVSQGGQGGRRLKRGNRAPQGGGRLVLPFPKPCP